MLLLFFVVVVVERERKREGMASKRVRVVSTTFTHTLIKREKRNREKGGKEATTKAKKTRRQKKRKAHRIRRAVEAEKRARRDDAFEKHAQHFSICSTSFLMILMDKKEIL